MKNRISKSISWTLFLGFIFLIILSLLRCLLGFYFKAPLSEDNSLLNAYLLGMRYDLRYVGITMMLTFLLSLFNKTNPFTNAIGKKIATGIWLTFTLLICLLYTTDFVHFAYLHQRLNASVLSYLENLTISSQMMWQSYPIIKIIFGLTIVIYVSYKIIQISFISIAKTNRPHKTSFLSGLFIFFLFAYSIVGNIVYSGGQYPLRWSDAYSLGSDYKANLALNPFQSFFSTLDFRNASANIDLLKNEYSSIADYLEIPKEQRDAQHLQFKRIYTQQQVANETKIKNVVLVICESYSMYKSSILGNPLHTTPYFTSLCKNGVFFSRAFSPAYGTARGVWAALTGIPDVQVGKTSSRNPMAVDQHMILNDFKDHEKFYFLGGSASWANIRGVLNNNIPDLKIYEQGSYAANEVDVWGISDNSLFIEANSVLKQKSKPFFAIIQTADNHRPYTIPKEDQKSFIKVTVPLDSLKMFGFESNDEFNAFRYTDFCIQNFIEAAKKEKYFNETLFVFVGDHGIKGDAGSMLPRVFSENNLTNMHVPLLFYAPSLLKTATYSTPVSQIDVMPSIASLMNINYTNTTLGRNVFSLNEKNNSIFLYDDFAHSIGLFNNQYYVGFPINNTKQLHFKSSIDNQKIVNDSALNAMKKMTELLYETSKYMLTHNQKSK
jgi:phosphoglycerol transferase MdoB-like AlkP superfamily enzyme